MKLISNKNNVYVFRSYPMLFHLFSFLLLCISAILYFHDHNLKKALICICLSLFFTYLGTVYYKMTFDLNQGLVHCWYCLRFKVKKYDFAINDIEKITAEERIINYKGNKTTATSLSIHTTASDNNVITIALGTNKDKLHESVELMNSLLDQYKQKQRQGAQS